MAVEREGKKADAALCPLQTDDYQKFLLIVTIKPRTCLHCALIAARGLLAPRGDPFSLCWVPRHNGPTTEHQVADNFLFFSSKGKQPSWQKNKVKLPLISCKNLRQVLKECKYLFGNFFAEAMLSNSPQS